MTTDTLQTLALDRLKASPLNPRRTLDKTALDELVASIKITGILQPLIVRPNGDGYEIAAGHRRASAARIAGLTEVPCVVRDLDDVTFRDLLVFENDAHATLTPLDQAAAFHSLMQAPTTYSVSQIATRCGRSKEYVYDRLRLLSLAPKVRTLLDAGDLPLEHALLIARLKPAEQTRLCEGALWQDEHLLWGPDDKIDARRARKPISVREVQAWIDQHVRFDVTVTTAQLFPETVRAMGEAEEKKLKVVSITESAFVAMDARDSDERTYGPQSWKRADGTHKSKTCAHAVLGVLVVGPGRGAAFNVCVEKKKCRTHWAEEQKAAKARAAAPSSENSSAAARERAKYEAEQKQHEAARALWLKETPTILAALAARVPKLSLTTLGDLLIAECGQRLDPKHQSVVTKLVPRGTSAETVLRHAVFLLLADDATAWNASRTFAPFAKKLGVDIPALLKAKAARDAKPETK